MLKIKRIGQNNKNRALSFDETQNSLYVSSKADYAKKQQNVHIHLNVKNQNFQATPNE